ncbi:MAG: META domain-containing protein, partial [Plesiomonas sp.]
MRTHALALLTASALLAGCSTVSTAPNIEGNWQQTGVSADIKPTTFEMKDGRMAAFAGCNRMMGMAAVENGYLVVKGMAATMMMCPPEAMQREQAFTELLNSKPAVKITGNTLT